MKITTRRGFTLLEVMIFIVILSMVLITATSFITKLLVSIRSNENRIGAAFLADDVKEWLSGERESNSWSTFHAKASQAGIQYCLNNQLELTHTIASLNTPAFPAAACTTYASIQTGMKPIYKRELVLYRNNNLNPTQVTAAITISWIDNGIAKSLFIQTIYTSPF
jgi:prepilin-type N-terminal cleavage/methylation domain-containing protein